VRLFPTSDISKKSHPIFQRQTIWGLLLKSIGNLPESLLSHKYLAASALTHRYRLEEIASTKDWDGCIELKTKK
jgi:hypothetical protein